MRTRTFFLTLLMASALQAQPLLDAASSTLQPALQQLGRRLLRHKTGSIVAIQPATGRVLCLVTHSPEGEKPALALATPYPPGSTMKTAEALMLYSEGIIDDETTVACHGALRSGNIRVRCHSHASPLRLTNALAYSCNTWFLSTFLRMMGDRDRYETKDSAITVWNRYMRSMGLGGPTGIDMEGEKGGLLANASYLNRRYDGRWNAQTVMWIAMGQGDVTATPLQLCVLAFLHRQPWLVVPSPSPRLRPRPSALRALRHAPFHQGHPCRLCRRRPGYAPGRPPRYADGRENLRLHPLWQDRHGRDRRPRPLRLHRFRPHGRSCHRRLRLYRAWRFWCRRGSAHRLLPHRAAPHGPSFPRLPAQSQPPGGQVLLIETLKVLPENLVIGFVLLPISPAELGKTTNTTFTTSNNLHASRVLQSCNPWSAWASKRRCPREAVPLHGTLSRHGIT